MMNGLSRQAARGAAWTATAQLGGQLVLLAANVVLARVLMPADFGTASLALVIAVLITAVNQLGLVAAVIQRREITRNHYVTAFTTSIISSAVFGLALFAGAVPVAHLLRNPGLVPVLRLYSLLLPLGAIAAIQSALLARHLMFRPMAKAALAARLIACANLVPRLESHYRWQGKLESAAEVLLLMKTTRARVAVLEELVLARHPYDTPEFVVLPITTGSQRYLDWLAAGVR